jgi:hypothetical protein
MAASVLGFAFPALVVVDLADSAGAEVEPGVVLATVVLALFRSLNRRFSLMVDINSSTLATSVES